VLLAVAQQVAASNAKLFNSKLVVSIGPMVHVCVCALQAYSFVDQCDSPWNKLLTMLGKQVVQLHPSLGHTGLIRRHNATWQLLVASKRS
jgi:hypothetical protein